MKHMVTINKGGKIELLSTTDWFARHEYVTLALIGVLVIVSGAL